MAPAPTPAPTPAPVPTLTVREIKASYSAQWDNTRKIEQAIDNMAPKLESLRKGAPKLPGRAQKARKILTGKKDNPDAQTEHAEDKLEGTAKNILNDSRRNLNSMHELVESLNDDDPAPPQTLVYQGKADEVMNGAVELVNKANTVVENAPAQHEKATKIYRSASRITFKTGAWLSFGVAVTSAVVAVINGSQSFNVNQDSKPAALENGIESFKSAVGSVLGVVSHPLAIYAGTLAYTLVKEISKFQLKEGTEYKPLVHSLQALVNVVSFTAVRSAVAFTLFGTLDKMANAGKGLFDALGSTIDQMLLFVGQNPATATFIAAVGIGTAVLNKLIDSAKTNASKQDELYKMELKSLKGTGGH